MPPTLAIIKDNGMTEHVADLAMAAGFREEDIAIARDEAAAMALLAQGTSDVYVVDPHLTRNENLEDGIRVIGAIREQSKICIIICLTARGSTELGIRARTQGANDYIDLDRSYVNGWEDLRERLKIERGVIASREKTVAPKQ